jgi:hypothetical protein
MASSMTSHATIGNSTFAEPRSADTTMSSIDGPSDFTDNMFDYMKGNKKPTAKKSSNVKPKRKYHLKPEESGIVIESPSEFSDDLTGYMMREKAMSSPAKSDKSELDGPSDFTANIVDYMRENKAYSPPARASPDAGVGKVTNYSPLAKEFVPRGNNTSSSSSSARTSPKQNPSTSAAKSTSPEHRKPRASASQAYSSSIRPSPTPSISPRRNVATNSTKLTLPHDKMSVVSGRATPVSIPKSPPEQSPASKTAKSATSRLEKNAVDSRKSFSKPKDTSTGCAIETDSKPLPKINKNLIINGPSNFTTGIAAFINGTTARSASVHTTATPKLAMRPMSSPAKGENFDINVQPDFASNLADYMKGTKKQSSAVNTSSAIKKDIKGPVPAAKTRAVDTKVTKCGSSSNHDDSEVEGPSDFTENLFDYMKGNKTYSPNTKTSSSATIAAASSATEEVKMTSSNANEGDLRAQIAQLQAQLLQKDDTINGLQTSLTAAEKKSSDLQSELNQKDTTINTLQTTLKQSNQQCQGLEFELHQMKVEVDDLQGNLNVSPGSDPANGSLGADDPPQHVILNTVQHKDRVINRLHNNNETLSGRIADLRVEMGDKDLLLIEHVEEVRKPQSEMDCELLKDALSHYADDLNAQYELSDNLAADKKELEGIIAVLQKRRADMEERMREKEEKAEKREEEWQSRAELLMKEIDRRGAACMQLWGQLEHPGERDGKGGQKYTYKYTKKSTKGASLF